MRALNFFFIFLLCLALVFFSIENTQPVAIQVIEGVQVKAPLCVELIVATGLGAILAWLFSLWSRLQRTLASRQQLRQVREKEQRIQELEQNLERYKVEVETKQPLLESAETTSLETAATEVKAASITAN